MQPHFFKTPADFRRLGIVTLKKKA